MFILEMGRYIKIFPIYIVIVICYRIVSVFLISVFPIYRLLFDNFAQFFSLLLYFCAVLLSELQLS